MTFWDAHGIIGGVVYLFFLAAFPRLTLFFMLPFSFSLVQWGFLAFIPRFWAAYLGTKLYWDTDPVLCVLAWMVAAGVFSKGTQKSWQWKFSRYKAPPKAPRFTNVVDIEPESEKPHHGGFLGM